MISFAEMRKKVVTTKQRRQVVTHLLAAFAISARRACRLVNLSRSRWQYRSQRSDDAGLRARLRELAAAKPRWGYQQLHILLRREGHRVNHKKVLRLYREKGSRSVVVVARNTSRSRGCRCRSPRVAPNAGVWTS